MNSTGACRITLVGPDGAPISGAIVLMSPNQLLPGVGNTFFGGFAISSLQVGEMQKGTNARSTQAFEELAAKWRATTDETGRALIEHLPYPKSESLGIEHPQFVPSVDKWRQRTQSIKVESGKTVELLMELEGIDAGR